MLYILCTYIFLHHDITSAYLIHTSIAHKGTKAAQQMNNQGTESVNFSTHPYADPIPQSSARSRPYNLKVWSSSLARPFLTQNMVPHHSGWLFLPSKNFGGECFGDVCRTSMKHDQRPLSQEISQTMGFSEHLRAHGRRLRFLISRPSGAIDFKISHSWSYSWWCQNGFEQ